MANDDFTSRDLRWTNGGAHYPDRTRAIVAVALFAPIMLIAGVATAMADRANQPVLSLSSASQTNSNFSGQAAALAASLDSQPNGSMPATSDMDMLNCAPAMPSMPTQAQTNAANLLLAQTRVDAVKFDTTAKAAAAGYVSSKPPTPDSILHWTNQHPKPGLDPNFPSSMIFAFPKLPSGGVGAGQLVGVMFLNDWSTTPGQTGTVPNQYGCTLNAHDHTDRCVLPNAPGGAWVMENSMTGACPIQGGVQLIHYSSVAMNHIWFMNNLSGGPFESMPMQADYHTILTQLPEPEVTTISPNTGTTGTTVTLTGDNFSAVSSVKFGGVSASFTVKSSTQIVATSPALAPAHAVDVLVTTATGTSEIYPPADAFTASGTPPTPTPTPVPTPTPTPKPTPTPTPPPSNCSTPWMSADGVTTWGDPGLRSGDATGTYVFMDQGSLHLRTTTPRNTSHHFTGTLTAGPGTIFTDLKRIGFEADDSVTLTDSTHVSYDFVTYSGIDGLDVNIPCSSNVSTQTVNLNLLYDGAAIAGVVDLGQSRAHPATEPIMVSRSTH